LTRIIAQLRRALGDDAREARYIETVPTRGYRFIAEVEVKSGCDAMAADDLQAEEVKKPAAPRRLAQWRPLALLGGVALILMVAIFAWKARTRAEWAVVLKTTQITTSPAMDIYPAFSPDGGAIAYSSLRNGHFEIFVKQLAPGSREIQITEANRLSPASKRRSSSLPKSTTSRFLRAPRITARLSIGTPYRTELPANNLSSGLWTSRFSIPVRQAAITTRLRSRTQSQ
jgi:hypothetical protein